MENTTSQQPYHDSPPPSPTSTPTPTHHTFPSTTSITIKPLPALPHEATMPTPDSPTQPHTPYRDDPEDDQDTSAPPRHNINQPYQPYTDSPPLTPNTTTDDDNIPLAHLLLHPYPTEAPPSYSVAIRQSHQHQSSRYHDTLIQYIPDDTHTIAQYLSQHEHTLRPVLIEIDSESGEVVSRTDDVRHSVERVVAMFVVAGLLLVVSGVLGWLALGSGYLR